MMQFVGRDVAVVALLRSRARNMLRATFFDRGLVTDCLSVATRGSQPVASLLRLVICCLAAVIKGA